MNTYRNHIKEDTSVVSLALSYEENMIALRCAEKVKSHLKRQLEQGNFRYQQNMQIVEEVIAAHKRRIEELGNPLGLYYKAS